MKRFLLPMMLASIIPAAALAEEAFVTDKHGCKLLDTGDNEPLVYDWQGKCQAGYAEGAGVLLVNRPDGPYQKEKVTFRKGLREGQSATSYLDGGPLLSAEAEYVHGRRNGKWVLHFSSGDDFEKNYVDGVATKHIIMSGKNGFRFEGEEVSVEEVTGKRQYINGDQYEGTLTNGFRNGSGMFTRKGGQTQVGEFILDEFVDVNDEAVKELMPARFGLELGMTRKQVEALSGEMTESASSSFRNACEVKHFPNEKFAASNMTIGKRTVYFDEDGKLWRIWAEILLKEDSYFGGGEVMQSYGTIKKWLSLTNEPFKSVQTYPHYQDDISSCRDAAEWKKDDPESFEMAQQLAPRMAHAQRVVFDIGCGAIPPWQSAYLSKNGKERYSINIRYGNLYATPLAYSAAVANEEEMSKKMWKTAEQKK